MRIFSIGGAPSIETQPEVVLGRWGIFELPDGSRHFCGYFMQPTNALGRVSSAIVRFDAGTLTGTTQSGRVYRLDGPRGDEDETRDVRMAWLIFNGCDPATVIEVEPADFGAAVH